MEPTIDVREDDLAGSEVQALIAEHLAGVRDFAPPGQVHALAIEGLRAPGIVLVRLAGRAWSRN